MARSRSLGLLAAAVAACLLVTAAPAAAQGAAAAAGPTGAAAAAGPIPASSLAGACQSSVSVSPWDIGNNFPDVVLCCGGFVNFQWSGRSGVWQTLTSARPMTFTNSSTARQLLPTTVGSGGVKSLYFAIPGTFYLTSPVAGASGLTFRVQVPPNSGTACASPPGAPTPGPTPAPGPQSSSGPGSMAAAEGSPGGTSTSTGPGSAASASGPPGTSQTATGPGAAFSRSGGRRLRWDEAW